MSRHENASNVRPIELLVIGHAAATLPKFDAALAALDRPYVLRQVNTCAELEIILAAASQLIVVANDTHQGFTLTDVIHCCKTAPGDAPLIVVSEYTSDSAHENAANSMIRNGVQDYVYMDRLYRLFWAVQRELVRLDLQRDTRRFETRLAAILNIAPDAVIAADANHRIIVFNRRAEEIFGYSPKEAVGQQLESLMPDRFAADHRARVAHFAEGPLQAREMGSRGTITARRKDGTEFPAEVSISILREDTGPVHIAILRDATEKQRTAEKMAYLATHDSLTRLPNRALLNDRLPHALARAERENQLVALMFIDLDGFKQINDSLGHSAGDQLLRTIAERLITCTRQSDTVARLGGDEFAVVLEGIENVAHISEIAENMLTCLSEPILLGEHCVQISASIGITIASFDPKSTRELMIDSDRAMYRAKAEGKNRFVFHSDSAMREESACRNDRYRDGAKAGLTLTTG